MAMKSGRLEVARVEHCLNRWGSFLTLLLCPVAVFAQEPFALVKQGSYHYLEEIFARVSAPEEATRAFYEALEKLSSASEENEKRLQRLYADIVDIMTAEESRRWKALKTAQEKVAFLRHFWLMRDMTPATEVNERLVEHYNRLAYARKKYAYFDARGYDDRGEIYVRFGAPDERVLDDVHQSSDPIETWAYYRLGAPVTFDFIDKGYGYRLAARFDE